MLIVGDATLCFIDGADAAAHGIVEGNIISFICHLNLVGWTRLILLILKELYIRYGSVIIRSMNQFLNHMLEDVQLPAEKQKIKEFYSRLEAYDQELTNLLADYMKQIEEEYRELYLELKETFDCDNMRSERAAHSVRLAQLSGVPENKIIKSRKDLDDLFG